MSPGPPTWTDLLAADREGRVTWPTCPVCGQDVKGYTQEAEYEEVPEMARLWPGGPVVTIPGTVARQRLVNCSFTSDTCGHSMDGSALRWTIRER